MSILKATNLRKQFKKRVVVNDASLEVKQGQVVGLLGPNGAGKTTCFYMMVGLIAADGGQIMLDNQDITKLPIDKRALLGIGYLPQEASIFRKLSVADNILAILQTRKLSKEQQHERLEYLLSEFQITHIRDSLGMSLSGGERRRVEIARALAIEPKFILLDEPFAGVDPISVNDIQSMITKLAHSNVGVLITDHNVRETLNICELSYILGEGEIIIFGTKEDVLSNKKVKEVYLGDNFKI